MSERERLDEVYGKYRDDETQDRWSDRNPGNQAIIADLVATADALLSRLAVRDSPLRVLDLGCGSESTVPALAFFERHPATFVGMDILVDRVRDGAAGGQHDLYLAADGTALPFGAATFDMVSLSTVLSSILDDGVRRRLAAEALRVLRPGGTVLWFDMRYPNPQNPNLRPVTRPELEGLFPHTVIEATPACLLPPVARRLGAATGRVYPILRAIRPLRSHLVATLTKRPAT